MDGGTHSEPLERAADAARTIELEGLGYRIVRVTNRDVYDNLNGVLDGLLAILEAR